MTKFIVVFLGLFVVIQSTADEYRVSSAEFHSHGAKLSGSIVLPVSGKVHAAVVFVHGSGKQTRNMHWAKRFASAGIAALVYDKRGAGLSGGSYEGRQSVSEKNIRLLADDAGAALDFLRSYAPTKAVPLGLTGISQAGWIAPLAAEEAKALDFMVLWSAPVCKVSEEDIFSKYTADRDGQTIPAYEEALTARKQKYIWPDFLGLDSDPNLHLSKLNIPALWIFGEQDGSVPVDLSIQRLKQHIASGKDYEYVLFSALGHNNMAETFPVATDWIHRLPTH